MGPDGYLEHVRRAKLALSIPVVGSLNALSTGGWVSFARLIQDAGADALEHLAEVRSRLLAWMETHDYGSIAEMQGSMSYRAVADPTGFERANYMKVLGAYALRGALHRRPR